MIRIIFTQKFWHELFEAGIFLKALNGLWEITFGTLILLNLNFLIFDLAIFQFVNNHLNRLSEGTKNFIGLYLLFHGLVNIILAYNLFRNRLWAYPFSMTVTGLFLIYQAYRLFHTHSIILLCLTLFDIAFIYLTWHEYHYQQRKRQQHLEHRHTT